MPKCKNEYCKTDNVLANKFCSQCGTKMPIDIDDLGSMTFRDFLKLTPEEQAELEITVTMRPDDREKIISEFAGGFWS